MSDDFGSPGGLSDEMQALLRQAQEMQARLQQTQDEVYAHLKHIPEFKNVERLFPHESLPIMALQDVLPRLVH